MSVNAAALLSRVRDSYHRQSKQQNWTRLDGERGKAQVSADVLREVATRLEQP